MVAYQFSQLRRDGWYREKLRYNNKKKGYGRSFLREEFGIKKELIGGSMTS
jgi:hypothetical protein